MLTANGPAALTQMLSHGGHLSADWRGPFLRVDRARFIPDRIWVRGDDGYTPLDRAADPDRWDHLAYADEALVTQVEDPPDAEVARTPSSSASMPRIVARMLAALRAEDGHRVLEIGAGTGYNAALLAARLGDEQVTSVEVDAELAKRARASLKTAGYAPAVVTGDGAEGWVARAPYDRLIATCSVHDVPRAWIEQTKPDGIIVIPWGTTLRNGVLLQLTVEHCPDGPVASGRVVDDAAFMWMRAQAPPRDVMAIARAGGETHDSHTGLDPHVLGNDDAWFAVGVLVPGCQWATGQGPDGAWTLWLADAGTGSWASVDYEPDAVEYDVQQHGPRRLWAEVEAAHAWWADAGRPARTQFGLTVTPAGQQVWLDDRGNALPV
ncbi:methyltransferase domain-containing protein [Streptomyces violaceusniger]|uniref:Protein-L-isoaspartate O-methyltransferase n=1 Tax=Streptomyces violaceusniger (strain Tu 4113) TaxID=653045 RepID=G2PD01_STRV4|nr:methyltransferase domain-containing protein [Streptomyces violaceusniger]AEM82627.1 protein-L-isoaspartate(D-aspartate) O-methyltransferase [Streptomyces violaceusniger Tu 4113]